MPTGYTADLKPNSDFATFAKTCARAFGAAIHLRDEPLAAGLPEPTISEYHPKKLEADTGRLARVEKMTAADADAAAAAAHEEAMKRYRVSLRRFNNTSVAYRNMLDNAERWTPPTPDHQGLKDFMIQQLTESLKWDCGTKPTSPTAQTGAEWLADEVKELRRSIDYHTKAWQEEQERHADRAGWIRDLNASLEASNG